MKIGIYSTNNTIYPNPKGTIYANMTVAVNLADGLTKLGHDVTLFAPKGTVSKAKIVDFGMESFDNPDISKLYPHSGSSYQYENILLVKALNYSEENKFDIFQSHTRPFSIVSMASLKPTLPTVITIHDPLTDEAFKILPQFNQFKNLHFTSLSKSQQADCKDLNWQQITPNGIEIEKFLFNDHPQGYLLYSGRIMPEKGVDLAVKLAKKLDLPLKICGSIYAKDQPFFDEFVKPFLNEKIEYLGVLERESLPIIYANAKATLMPIKWNEPFGLVAIEAMACGTPVIASNTASMPEIISNNETGFLANSEEEFEEAIKKVDQIKRVDCRKHVESNFTIEKMSERYEQLYKEIL